MSAGNGETVNGSEVNAADAKANGTHKVALLAPSEFADLLKRNDEIVRAKVLVGEQAMALLGLLNNASAVNGMQSAMGERCKGIYESHGFKVEGQGNWKLDDEKKTLEFVRV